MADSRDEKAGFLQHTREGFVKGISSSAHRDYSWVTKGVGAVFGGVSGYWTIKTVAARQLRRTPASGFVIAPALAMGTIACAGLGKELAQASATAGIKVGKTVTLTSEGLSKDIFGPPEPEAEKAGPRARTTAHTKPFPVPTGHSIGEHQALVLELAALDAEMKTASLNGDETTLHELQESAGDVLREKESCLQKERDLRKLTSALSGLRASEKAIKGAVDAFTKAGGDAGSPSQDRRLRQLQRIRDEKQALKNRASSLHAVSLSKEIEHDLHRMASSLYALRVREQQLKNQQGPEGRHSHSRDLADIAAEKKRLKLEVMVAYNVQLAKVRI